MTPHNGTGHFFSGLRSDAVHADTTYVTKKMPSIVTASFFAGVLIGFSENAGDTNGF